MKINGTNLTMIRGDTEAIKLTVKNNLGEVIPLDLGDTVYFTVKTSPNLKTKIMQKVITEFNEGLAVIPINPIDTKDLMVGTYTYDIQLNRANGDVKTIIPPSLLTIASEVTYE